MEILYWPLIQLLGIGLSFGNLQHEINIYSEHLILGKGTVRICGGQMDAYIYFRCDVV